jgi:diguanylate cyclase (GGDEF)-like protein
VSAVEPLAVAFDWARRLLEAGSFPAWLEAAAAPPGSGGGEVVSMLLADPASELRVLAAGDAPGSTTLGPISFVDSLAGRAPELGALHAPWCGPFRAADHGLLFPTTQGITQLLLLPLHRHGQLVGVYGLGGRDAPPSLASADRDLLRHLAVVIAASVERQFERARLLRGGFTDPLTGWNPARYLKLRLREELARCQRHGGSVACLVVDIDRLQQVNDEYGQPAGDSALRELAARVESQVRASDATARIGSDEFGVVLPATDAAGAVPMAKRILAAVARAPVDLGGGLERALTVSIGIAASAPARGDDRKALSEQLVANAAAAMHRAKQRGGGGYDIAS